MFLIKAGLLSGRLVASHPIALYIGVVIRLTNNDTGCRFLGVKKVPIWIYVINWYDQLLSNGERSMGSNTYRMSPLAFEALLMVLALYKATEFWRLYGFHGSRLLRVLITDQIIYFIL